MTVGEKVEQFFTGRPNSLVPGRTLQHLFGLASRPDNQMWTLNMAMHYGQGAVAGIVRAIMGANGIRGPFADFMFTGVRLLIDQTLENWTGVGAPPWYLPSNSLSFWINHSKTGWLTWILLPFRTWPVNEQIIDIVHKAVFAFATGYFVDRWVQ